MGFIKQGNKEFSRMKQGGREVYFVARINGESTHGRQGSYPYVKCEVCGRIVGTQFRAHLTHFKTHEK